jgi:putative DNA-invertase from lambdoid prophage Rac
MAVYGYVRVSTGRQVDEGESLDVQDRIIAGWALVKGLALTRTCEEGG